jgi:AraC family transcriptional regulator, regulatory protein of adaptative response / DNA-3-methyladenine glycosylase II
MGRWLAQEHPEIIKPSQCTRQTCAAWVAAVDRMAVGDHSQSLEGKRSRAGDPLSPGNLLPVATRAAEFLWPNRARTVLEPLRKMAGSVWRTGEASGYSGGMGAVYGLANGGIYCCPGCGPQLKEAARYPVPASAEAAGMRACLSCRPYRYPQSLTRNAPELVCRAVRLILDGALDGDTEAALAARIGLSARHLHRLFVTHLGVTPDGLARSGRAHFARRLLDDTDLPITEVAFVAGYGSARQFNREFKRIFRATPSQLRASRPPSPSLAADGGLALRLWFTGPLEWEALGRFLAARAIPGVEHVDGRAYRRTIHVDDVYGVLELSPGSRDYLTLRVHLPRWETLIHVVAQARKIACLDEDTAEPIRSLAADPLIGVMLAAWPGIRVPGAWDPFEVGVAAIIEQQSTPAATHQVMEQIVTRFGRPVPGLAAFGLTHIFPPPATIARAGTDLEMCGLAGHQAQTLVSYASAIEHAVIRLDNTMTYQQLMTAIGAVPGITASTAQYIALRMGDPDAFPADDRVLKQSLGQFTTTLSPALPHRWQPWRSYAAAHLWAAAGRPHDSRHSAAKQFLSRSGERASASYSTINPRRLELGNGGSSAANAPGGR